MSTGFPDWTTEQALASLVAGGSVSFTPGGVPLLHGYDVVLGPNSANNVPANSSIFLGADFTKPGYYVSIKVSVANAAATIPFLSFSMTWQDSTHAVNTAQQDWIIPATSSGTYIVQGGGPVRGQHVSMKLQNLDPAFAMTATVTILETTQAQTRDDWRGLSGGTIPGFNQPGQFIDTGLMIGTNAVPILASSTFNVLLPLWCGEVDATFLAASATTLDFALTIPSVLPGSPFGGGSTIFNATGAGFNERFVFPRIPLLLSITSTAASNWSAYMTFLEAAS